VGRSLLPLQLTVEEKSRLADWAHEQTTTHALAVRARIVLECSRGSTNTQVSRRLRIPMQTVGKWRRRFTVRRLEGLLDAPRPGRPRGVSDAKMEEVLALTLARKPQAPTGWNSRLMAKATGVNQTAIVRIWKTLGMQVRRVETFELVSERACRDEVAYRDPITEMSLKQVR
jgi:transposase